MHPANPERTTKALEALLSPGMPDGLSAIQTSVEFNQSFKISLSEFLSVRANMRMSGLGYDDVEGKMPFSTNLVYASAHADLDVRECNDGVRREGQGADLFEHEAVIVCIPEWTRHVTGDDVDTFKLTQQLAFTGEALEYQFPGPELTGAEDAETSHRARNLHERDAIEWLLERIEDGRAVIDLDNVRVEAGGDVYDGHGRLITFPMSVSRQELQSVVEERGEEAIRQAFEIGVLFSNGSAVLEGRRARADRVDRICDVLTGRETGYTNFRFRVAWEHTMFEETIRPHLSEAPFARSPRTIDEKCPALMMLDGFLERH